jgi:Tol biopolymer transport system component
MHIMKSRGCALPWLALAGLLAGSCLHKPAQWSPELEPDASPRDGSDATGRPGSDPTPELVPGSPSTTDAASPGEAGGTSPDVDAPPSDARPTPPDGTPTPDGPPPETFTWELVSAGMGGAPANGPSRAAALSGDGRYVVFASAASNLVPGDTNNALDIFRLDRQTRTMVRVNVASDGTQANAATRPDISLTADGRSVLFVSAASNLVAGDSNSDEDVFLRDVQAEVTTRVSTTSTNAEIRGQSASGAIAASGRYIAFTSNANGVLPGQQTRLIEAYYKDLTTGSLIQISSGNQVASDLWLSASGTVVAFLASDVGSGEGIFHVFNVASRSTTRVARLGADLGSSVSASFSADGMVFAFDSWKDPTTDTPATHGVYLLTRATGAITRLSATPEGTPANRDSYGGDLSADGRLVAFSSSATNLGTAATGRMEPRILDRQTGRIRRLPGGNAASYVHSFSADGRTIAIASESTDLTPNDSNSATDIFVASVPPP